MGHGFAQSGNYSSAMNGVGQFWSMGWTLSTETSQKTIPLRLEWTKPPPGCGSSGINGAYVHRGRTVTCPAGFSPNINPPPSNRYCFRTSFARDPAKNLGQSCPVMLGNPMNGSTGNKLQVEMDYQDPSGSALRFVRYYNSFLTTYYGPGSTKGILSSLGPNWRSSYERLVRFNDSTMFPTAYVYRPDGQTLYFKLLNGQFVPDGDIEDRLVRLFDLSGVPQAGNTRSHRRRRSRATMTQVG